MFTRTIRKNLARPEGQALVLACLMMLIVAISVLATVNIGHTVHERIRLQNNADAAAYSTAAMEARAFNFYAFANRTQVSHYVSAMVFQSFNSFIYFLEAFFTDLFGVAKSLIGKCNKPSGVWKILCPILKKVPYLGQALTLFDQILNALRMLVKGYQSILKAVQADKILGKIVSVVIPKMNNVMAAMQQLLMYSTLSHVLSNSGEILEANDPNLKSWKPMALLSGTLGACMYNRAHFKEANGTPFSPRNPFNGLDPAAKGDGNRVARAKTSMANVSNGSRFGCDADKGFSICPETFVTSRKLGDLLPIPDFLKPLESLLNGVAEKQGQTRLLSYKIAKGDRKWGGGGPPNTIRKVSTPTFPSGMNAMGDALGADDTYAIKIGPARFGFKGLAEAINPFSCDDRSDPAECWGDPSGKGKTQPDDRLETSIWALHKTDWVKGGIHWHIAFPGSGTEKDIGINKINKCIGKLLGVCVAKMDIYVANVRGLTANTNPRDGNHDWPGMQPFSHFEPGQYANECKPSFKGATVSTSVNAAAKEEFNQPSTWMVLYKTKDELLNPLADPTGGSSNKPALVTDDGKLKMDPFQTGGTELNQMNQGMAGGMTVVARGQVYYHRPGNWNEQPNFFNPYWRPRLASVWQGKDQLPFVEQALNGLPAALKNMPQKFITH